ncbi:MAG: Glu/Leu/Phe/Val dehydrogenase dimerization domain-containing protein [Alphaproteobacteria bacterium]
MAIFKSDAFDGHEGVHFFHDADSGLKAIIAIHNTNLGPSLGGCRFWNYASEEEAHRDVLRLSRGMTYKAAITGLPLGGGKSVIIGDAARDKSPALFRAFGRAVESLGGRYITAEDVNTKPSDMEFVRAETSHVRGLQGTGGSGDPSPVTAYGVFVGLKASVLEGMKTDSLKGVRVAVQGLGNVGYHLCKLLHAEGAVLFVSDINAESVNRVVTEFGATAVLPEAIHAADVDVFAPCALGGILNDQSIEELKAGVICGAANNQLAEARHGIALMERGITYAPDYLVNAGGLINVFFEGPSYNRDIALAKVDEIGATLAEVFDRARAEGIATSDAADRVAESRFMVDRSAMAAAAQ